MASVGSLNMGLPVTPEKMMLVSDVDVLYANLTSDPLEIDFLWEMSKTVMSHLVQLRRQAELGRGTDMLTGLGNLVRTSSAGLTGRERIPQPLLQNSKPSAHAEVELSENRRSSLKEGELAVVDRGGSVDTSSKGNTIHGLGASLPAGKFLRIRTKICSCIGARALLLALRFAVLFGGAGIINCTAVAGFEINDTPLSFNQPYYAR